MMSVESIAVALVGYLLGSIPFGVIVAKRSGVDIYSVGSGNPGATNVLREIGKPAGYLVFSLDFLKFLGVAAKLACVLLKCFHVTLCCLQLSP